MKKILAMVCSVVILAAIAISGTIAYFTDSDSATNVFTVGNVVIKLNEQQRDLDDKGNPVPNSTLEPFEDDKNLMPLVGTINATDVDDKGLPTARNFQDKIVTVKNTGKSEAYVRVYVGVPAELDKAEPQKALHFVDGSVYNTTNSTSYKFTQTGKTEAQKITIDSVEYEYNFYCFTLDKALAVGDTTGAAIVGFYLDSKVDYDDADGDLTKAAYYIGDKSNPDNKLTFDLGKNVNIPVYVQAVQTAGFDKAETAFTAAFEGKTPWGGTLPPTSAPSATPTPGPTVDTKNLPPLNPSASDANTYEIGTAAELYRFAKMVSDGDDFRGKTITLTSDIVLSDKQDWTPLGKSSGNDNDEDYRFAGTFDGGNHTIYYMTMKDDAYDFNNAGLFRQVSGTVRNLNIANANFDMKVGAWKKPNAGFIAGTLDLGGLIENCKVTNSTLNCNSENPNNYSSAKVGGIVGCISEESGSDNETKAKVQGCSVSGCTINGWGSTDDSKCFQAAVGGIAGVVNAYNALANCKVRNCTIKGDGWTNGCKIGGIIGQVYCNRDAAPLPAKLTGCKVEGSCKIYGTQKERTATIVGDVTNESEFTCDETTNTASAETKVYYGSGSDYTEIEYPVRYN